MTKTLITSLLIFISTNVFSGSRYITPADNEKIFKNTGELVYVECKKEGPLSTNCLVDCGNGLRFRKTSGYCHYLNNGTYALRVSTRYRNKNYTHTATVNVSDKNNYSSQLLSQNNENKNEKNNTPKEIKEPIPFKVSEDGEIATSVDDSILNDANKNALDKNINKASENNTLVLEQNKFDQSLESTDFDLNQELDSLAIKNNAGLDTFQQEDNNFGRQSLPPGGSFSGNDGDNQNQIPIDSQFVFQ
jgi:hypothetical protein